MKAIWKDTVIAESDDTIIVEGNHYFPATSINDEYFTDSDKTTSCSWKGTANYRSLQIDGETNTDAAFYYATPKSKAAEIAGRYAFWRGVQVVDQ